VFFTDRQNFRSYTYVPLIIIDKEFCLVIETDISVVKELLSKNRMEMAQWGLIIFLGVASIGAAFTISLIQPLNDLQEKARQVVREYSGDDSRAAPRGNEITTLVRAIHLMVETIRDHISERSKAEEQLRQSQKMEAIGARLRSPPGIRLHRPRGPQRRRSDLGKQGVRRNHPFGDHRRGHARNEQA
jgi:methyl-accepting chemotaxis protein